MSDKIFAGVIVAVLIGMLIFVIKCSDKRESVTRNLKCTCVEDIN